MILYPPMADAAWVHHLSRTSVTTVTVPSPGRRPVWRDPCRWAEMAALWRLARARRVWWDARSAP